MNEPLPKLPREDLDSILDATSALWGDLHGANVLITGGTGFIGTWLLSSLLLANDRWNLRTSVTVLTRKPESFSARFPHLAQHASVHVFKGDIRTVAFPHASFSHIIHGATDASARLNTENPTLMYDTIVEGTKRILELVEMTKPRRMLFISSGAVYGIQAPEISHMREEKGCCDVSKTPSAYAKGKIIAEQLCTDVSKKSGIPIPIARSYALVGPLLPLDIHFAMGNFIRDGLLGHPITVHGDGTPIRSYLYIADCAIWLWTIFLRGLPQRAYNLGSEEPISIRALAEVIARQCAPPLPVIIEQPHKSGLPERYVPSTERSRKELGLEQNVSLLNAVKKTLQWYQPLLSSSTESPGTDTTSA